MLKTILLIIGALILLYLIIDIISRVIRKSNPKPAPEWSTFLLKNPIRLAIQNPKKIVDMLKLKKDMKILEIGPGPGLFSIEAAKRLTDGQLYAVDISKYMLDLLKKKSKEDNITNI